MAGTSEVWTRATSSLIVHRNPHRIPRDLALPERPLHLIAPSTTLSHAIALFDKTEVRDFDEASLRPSAAGIQHQIH